MSPRDSPISPTTALPLQACATAPSFFMWAQETQLSLLFVWLTLSWLHVVILPLHFFPGNFCFLDDLNHNVGWLPTSPFSLIVYKKFSAEKLGRHAPICWMVTSLHFAVPSPWNGSCLLRWAGSECWFWRGKCQPRANCDCVVVLRSLEYHIYYEYITFTCYMYVYVCVNIWVPCPDPLICLCVSDSVSQSFISEPRLVSHGISRWLYTPGALASIS